MPSGTTETLAALPFAPTEATLAAALDVLDARGMSADDAALRRAAFARYQELPPPSGRPSRGWKHDYAKLRFEDLVWTSDRVSLPALPPRPAAPARDAAEDVDFEVDRPALATENAGGLYFLGGTYVDAPSAVDPRVTVLPLDAHTEREQAGVLRGVLHEVVDYRADAFTALATAFRNCGALVYVPAGVQLDAPVQLIFANGEARDEAVFPHVVVVLGEGARATVIERFVGEGDPFVCGIVEAHVADRAALEYVAVQQAGEAARVVMARGARCGRDARIGWRLAELGATLARTVLNARLDAPGARAETAALFFNTAMQHVDLTTAVDHAVGMTTSDTVVRTAATDRGQGHYVGNIVIRRKAHGADASLRDDALILGKRAHVDSIPALEIAANDVKAYHGATVGSLDEEALFYAGSRGIARAEALRLITLGFFEPAIGRFPGEPLRDEIRTALDRKIDDVTEIDG